MVAYIRSLKAAPTPVAKPNHRPLFRVRRTVSTPTGPIGALAMMPISMPFIIIFSVVIGSIIIIAAKFGIFFHFSYFFEENLCFMK